MTHDVTISGLHENHYGNFSDKWSLYLAEYDRLFLEYRDKPINLLEVGIQNGGSLEIWAKFFLHAKNLIGCDIDEKCASITFDDSRIKVIIGDANSQGIYRKVTRISDEYDVIIDDGSHLSSDIVKTFSLYFSHPVDGGIFIAEDLHCSYWGEFEGGLYDPYSSLAFFKKLADVVGHEHWNVEKSRKSLLKGFFSKYHCQIDEEVLSNIHSVEFINSICVVRKASASKNLLGRRQIVGSIEKVTTNLKNKLEAIDPPLRQDANPWSTRTVAPEEGAVEIEQQLNREQEQKLFLKEFKEYLEQQLISEQAQKVGLEQQLISEQAQKVGLEQQLISEQAQKVGLEQQVAYLNNKNNELLYSRSWKITTPLRSVANFIRKIKKFINAVFKAINIYGGLKLFSIRAWNVYRKNGIRGIVNGVAFIKKSHPETPAQNSDNFDRNDYQEWIKRYDTIDQDLQLKIEQKIKEFPTHPKISVLMPVFDPPLKYLDEAIWSVRNQIYANWQLCIADDFSKDIGVRKLLEKHALEDPRIEVIFRSVNGHISAASNTALDLVDGEFIALLDHDDLLPINALYWTAKTILDNPGVGLIYSDEDKINLKGVRYHPYFKCDLNPELLLAQNMISHLGVYRTELVKEVGGFRSGFEGSQDYDLALRVIEKIKPNQVIHIPRILYHWRAIPGSAALGSNEKNYAADAGRAAVAQHLERRNLRAEITPAPNLESTNRIRFDLPDELPLISIIIPTRDKVDILATCINSILERSTYPSWEIIILDNDSQELATQEYFLNLPSNKVRVIRDESEFNFSRLNNIGVRGANGDFVCLMNNDIEILTPDWLEEMLSFAQHPDVGCVGAKLWYPNGTLQHGGVLIGIGGVANHAHYKQHKGAAGYFGRAILHQSFSAVTGACLLVRKKVYEEVHGLDEQLAVAFNDVDFCLRVRELGYRNVWTPYAEMIHHESLSRGGDETPERRQRFVGEVNFMISRWGKKLCTDPAYNPNLTFDYEDFSLAWPPRVELI